MMRGLIFFLRSTRCVVGTDQRQERKPIFQFLPHEQRRTQRAPAEQPQLASAIGAERVICINELSMYPTTGSLASHAVRLAMSPDDATEFKHLARSYVRRLGKIEKAARGDDELSASLQIDHFLRSDGAKIVAVARTFKRQPVDAPVALTVLKARAGELNPFAPIEEAVGMEFTKKEDGTVRPISKFRWRRRALMAMCNDVLRACLLEYGFDYLQKGNGGMTVAFTRLLEQLEGGEYDHLGERAEPRMARPKHLDPSLTDICREFLRSEG